MLSVWAQVGMVLLVKDVYHGCSASIRFRAEIPLIWIVTDDSFCLVAPPWLNDIDTFQHYLLVTMFGITIFLRKAPVNNC